MILSPKREPIRLIIGYSSLLTPNSSFLTQTKGGVYGKSEYAAGFCLHDPDE